MCGISGYISFGAKRPSKAAITKVFTNTEDRGRDAAGFAYIDNGKLIVEKAAMTASKFVKEEAWTNLSLPKILIMHCRAATQGAKEDNKNNHPVFTNGIAVIHNGVIRNDHILFNQFKLKRDGFVDSEILVKLLDMAGGDWDSGMEMMNHVSGSFACASVQASKPDELMLWRHDNPLVLAYDKVNDILYFASTESIMKPITSGSENINVRGFELVLEKNNEDKFLIWSIPNDSGFLIGSEGVIKKFTLNPATTYHYSNFKGNNYYTGSHEGGATEGSKSLFSELFGEGNKATKESSTETGTTGEKDKKNNTSIPVEGQEVLICELCSSDKGVYRDMAECILCDKCWGFADVYDMGGFACCESLNVDHGGRCVHCGTYLGMEHYKDESPIYGGFGYMD